MPVKDRTRSFPYGVTTLVCETIWTELSKYVALPRLEGFMITEALNWLLDLWGSVFAGSSGYEIQPGTLPSGS